MIRKKILLTGGTGKIGTVFVKELLKENHILYVTTRNIINANIWLENNYFTKDNIILIECDFYSENAVDIIHRNINDGVDVIIHNARDVDTLRLDSDGKISSNQFQNELFIATVFPYLLTNKLLETNKKINDIIFISSMYGVVAPSPRLYENFEQQSPINYGIAKAAQIHLVKEMAIRYADLNIRVNSISYGGVEGRVSEDFKQRYSELCPLKRMLSDIDLFPPIKMIIDNTNLLITGENIKIDGGWTIW